MHPDRLISENREMICQACPNGCHLTTEISDDRTMNVTGHKCPQGVAFAARALGMDTDGSGSLPFTFPEMTAVAALWDIPLKTVQPQIDIQGSPERSEFRIVIEDTSGGRHILEQIPAGSHDKKMKVARALAYLQQQGLARINPYRPDRAGQVIKEYQGRFWQTAPFINGVPLDRTGYLYDRWRGTVLAGFLVQLRRASAGLTDFSRTDVFAITFYIDRLLAQIKSRRPELLPALEEIRQELGTSFFPAHDALPAAFCHGDYHPLNMVWGSDDIKAVIDWEFAGYKPEIYDTANLIGCLGVEHPSSLAGPLVLELIEQLKSAGLFAAPSWDCLPDFIVALRFAWLAEWLRKDDTAMVELEIDYMQLLTATRARLMKEWGLAAEPKGLLLK